MTNGQSKWQSSSLTRASRLVRPLIAAAAVGLVGLGCGYFGPLWLNPEANAGPLFGIFIAFPISFIVGLLFGVVAGAIRSAAFVISLTGLAIATAVTTLYFSLPDDRNVGFVIDAAVRDCKSPLSLVDASQKQWEVWNRETTWREPRPSWKEDISGMLTRDQGVVITLFINRRWEIYEQRKPWNRGQLRLVRSGPANISEDYFARSPNGSCQQFQARRAFFCPQWEPSRVSPPDILPTFLGLRVLNDVPPRFKPLLKNVESSVGNLRY